MTQGRNNKLAKFKLGWSIYDIENNNLAKNKVDDFVATTVQRVTNVRVGLKTRKHIIIIIMTIARPHSTKLPELVKKFIQQMTEVAMMMMK